MASPTTIRRLTDPTDHALPAVERIYVSALPAGERKPLGWLRSLAQPEVGATYALLVAEREGTVLGFAVLFAPADASDAALLEYLAVTEAARGGGVGGQLFAHAARSAGRPMLVEIDTTDPDADRRRAFYRRHGCRELVGLQYILPLSDAPPMGLMVAGSKPAARADLRRWLETVYAGVYGQRRDDPRIATMLAPVSDPVRMVG